MIAERPAFRHRLEHFLYRSVEAALARIDMESCVALGHGLGLVAHVASRKYRRLVERNLRIATASHPSTETELAALVKETFRRGGANFLASLKTQILPLDELAELVDPEALRVLDRNRREGHGTVIAMAHMGNWEALTRLGAKVLEPGSFGGVYRPLDNPLMDALTQERRTSTGARLFSRKDGYYAPSTFLRDGGALAVLGDQRAGARGTPMTFMGKITTCPPLLELMAKRGRARIVTLDMHTTGHGRWLLALHPLDPKSSTAEIMAALESVMLGSLPDVFWFHDRWRTDRRFPLSLFTRLDPEVAARASVPLRLVLSTPPDAPEDGVQAFLRRAWEIRPDLRVERLATPAARVDDPRVILHEWDPEIPETFADSVLEKIDRSHPAPLDGFLLFGSEPALARAARRMDHRAILGFGVKGRPWSRSLERPESLEAWSALADSLNFIPDKRRPS